MTIVKASAKKGGGRASERSGEQVRGLANKWAIKQARGMDKDNEKGWAKTEKDEE